MNPGLGRPLLAGYDRARERDVLDGRTADRDFVATAQVVARGRTVVLLDPRPVGVIRVRHGLSTA